MLGFGLGSGLGLRLELGILAPAHLGVRSPPIAARGLLRAQPRRAQLQQHVQLRLGNKREEQRRARMAGGPVAREESEQAVALGTHEDCVGLADHV